VQQILAIRTRLLLGQASRRWSRDPRRPDRARHAPAPVLVMAPPPIGDPKGPIAPKFAGGEAKSRGLAEEYRKRERRAGLPFLRCEDGHASSRAGTGRPFACAHHRYARRIQEVPDGIQSLSVYDKIPRIQYSPRRHERNREHMFRSNLLHQ